MLLHAEELKPGAIIFVRHTGFISWLIRLILRFDYSHVAYYMGMNQLLESDAGGVQLNPVSTYLDDARYMGEVVASPLSEELVDKMSANMLKYLQDKYDYSLLIGNAISKLTCNKRGWFARLLDHQRSWICSELIAEGLSSVGIAIPKPVANMTPKDIYLLIKDKGGTPP